MQCVFSSAIHMPKNVENYSRFNVGIGENNVGMVWIWLQYLF